MENARNNHELLAHIERLKKAGKRIGFVPTMGALHAGHLSLVQLAREHADAVVVSIFVNPTQFGQGEDFERYPRKEEEDLARLKTAGVRLVYLPRVEDIYPHGAQASVHVPLYTNILCGASRPGHFDGVATVVKRLFELVQPQVAVFGRKDYQQLMVIRWLVQSFGLKINLISAPIFRESDGLAMSSRNAYLTPAERLKAPLLYKAVTEVAAMCHAMPVEDAIARESQFLEKEGFRIDYFEVRNNADLTLVTGGVTQPARVFIAAWLGNTRLIDNKKIKSSSTGGSY